MRIAVNASMLLAMGILLLSFLIIIVLSFCHLLFFFVKMDIERFVAENLNEHRKGLLGKTVPVSNLLVWTKVSQTR